MERLIGVATAAGSARQVRLRGYPDQCPRCHSRVVPKLLTSVAKSEQPEPEIEEAFQCTSARCGVLFVAVYEWRQGTSPAEYGFARAIPAEPVKPDVSDVVTGLSPIFYETYCQAMAAEAFGLNQLTGIGLRKALEFLVKDFATDNEPAKKDEIVKKPLAKCITEHIDQPQVREVAKRATWLGNDEAHYVRKWEDKDISDLKVLIKLTINGIENVLLAKKYLGEMPAPKSLTV